MGFSVGKKISRWMILAMLVAPVIVFWADRGRQSFSAALGDFAPTPYERSESGRELLERVGPLVTRVGWKLADGRRQVAYYVPPRRGALIVYAHGSPGRGLGLYAGEAGRLVERGYGALLIDLPGYGASEGSRTWGPDFIESIRLALDFAVAQSEVDPDRIGGFGYSNGGCLIARAAAADTRLRAIVLRAAYTNLAEQLHFSFRRRTPGMGYFAIAAARWSGVPVVDLDTVAALQRMAARPTLILSGGADREIPRYMNARLKSAVPDAESIIYEDIGHLDFVQKLGESYIDTLENFFDGALEVAASAETG